MILEIKKYPNPVLRKKCQEVTEITDEIRNLSQDIKETVKQKDGLGLAAPQIGELKRIIIVQAVNGAEVFINPKITRKSKGTEIREEGCLSFPGLFLKIKRAGEIEMEFLNLWGEKKEMKAGGLSARIFQHEIDHLDGILLIDRIPFLQKLCQIMKFRFLGCRSKG
ncbi:MAG TPA: peptide deformylase [Patescibacteria group bacterium]|nr:peptide deformylase [Patescibacteria group bacterium]